MYDQVPRKPNMTNYHHTFTPKHVKPVSFVLRGLNVAAPIDDVVDELRDLGYPVC